MLSLGMFSMLTEINNTQNSECPSSSSVFVEKSSSNFAVVTVKKESFRSVLSPFSLLHTNPEAIEVRTSDGQIKPNPKHMLHRCLSNIQIRALANAETYVSGEICIKCKHSE